MTNKKQCEGQRSRKREVREGSPQTRPLGLRGECSIRNEALRLLGSLPLNNAVHVYRAEEITRDGEGSLAQSLLAYLLELRKRLCDGEAVNGCIFLQFGYSQRSLTQFRRKQTFHASGGANVPMWHLAVMDHEKTIEFVQEITGSVRGIIDDLNRESERPFRTVCFKIEETDYVPDPGTAFNPPEGAEVVGRLERDVTYRF